MSELITNSLEVYISTCLSTSSFYPLFTYSWATGPNLNRLIGTVHEIVHLPSLAVVEGTRKEA